LPCLSCSVIITALTATLIHMPGVTVEDCRSQIPFEEPDMWLRFETLLADLSAHFINLPADRIDGEILEAQRRVCEFIGIDLSTVWQWTDDNETQTLTHLYRLPGASPLPENADADEIRKNFASLNPSDGKPLPEKAQADALFPWTLEQLRAGRTVSISTENLPPEAARDREIRRLYGIKENLSFPLSHGGGPLIGALAFNYTKEDRAWSEDLVRRLRLVAQIFANALARKRSDDLLRESRERLSLATESAGMGLWIMDIPADQVWATDGARELFSLPSDEELTMESFIRAVHKDDRSLVRQALEQAMETERKIFFEYRVQHPDGRISWVSTRGNSRRNADGEIDKIMGATIDVSDRKQAEAEAQVLREELFHVTRVLTLGQLTAAITHEVNQPLAAIKSNAQAALRLLSRETPDLQEIHSALEDIVSDDNRAAEVIMRLRGMMKKERPRQEALDINDIVSQALSLVSGEASMKGISILLEKQAPLPALIGDTIQLQQVILNLIHNGAEAVISAAEGPREIVITTGIIEPGFITVTVSDSGTGVAEGDLERIFKSFFTTKPDGMGMGLAISRSIAEAHGGSLWASNNPGKGAAFHLSLPIPR
jgi:PAS domain S-box-containing protein